MKIALFTVEGLPNARAVRQLVSDHTDKIVYVGASDTHRPQIGGFMGQLKRHIARSGMWIVPYLFVNFCLPEITRLLFALFQPFVQSRATYATPLHDLCAMHGIPVHSIADVNHPSVIEAMRGAGVDLILSFHFDQIFKAKTLSSVPMGGINVHPSLLPHHRGPFPTFHALMEDEPLFGVTAHQLVSKIDAGEILEQTQMTMPSKTTATKAAMILFDEGRLCVNRILSRVEKGKLPPGRPNQPSGYCPWPSHEEMAEFHDRGRRLVDFADAWEAIKLS